MKKLRVTVGGVSYNVEVEILEDDDVVGSSYGFAAPIQQRAVPPIFSAPKQQQNTTSQSQSNSKTLTSPIAGSVIEIKTKEGASVKEGEVLLVIEAMKMNTNISSPTTGTVTAIKVQVGNIVQQEQILITFE